MILGVVRGSLYATIQHPFYRNRRLLLVEHLDSQDKPTGKYLIAVDSVDAGAGDRVVVLDEGTGARQVLNDPSGPVRSVIVGIVDAVDVAESAV
jgi:microcompartment protein CcmK/EutM